MSCQLLIAHGVQDTLLIKKQLLKATSAPESSFQSRLAAEQDTVAAYWTSVEGQDTLQAHLNKFIIEVNENDDEDEDGDDDEQVQTESEHESDMEIDL
ncbi:unnamed protein product [Plutella xylostella]|uniref:(diamondback moth) hypothetical protein n=1 Tax=Plutella xylostella TaxID=51655 RepID=A0A8S4D0X8_PLUXY|nr:unnamed protein product [Plutella xylostella]